MRVRHRSLAVVLGLGAALAVAVSCSTELTAPVAPGNQTVNLKAPGGDVPLEVHPDTTAVRSFKVEASTGVQLKDVANVVLLLRTGDVAFHVEESAADFDARAGEPRGEKDSAGAAVITVRIAPTDAVDPCQSAWPTAEFFVELDADGQVAAIEPAEVVLGDDALALVAQGSLLLCTQVEADFVGQAYIRGAGLGMTFDGPVSWETKGLPDAAPAERPAVGLGVAAELSASQSVAGNGNGNDNSGNTNDNSGNSNDNAGNTNDNGGNGNDNSGNTNGNDNSGNANGNDNGGNSNGNLNDNSGNTNGNDNAGNTNGNDNGNANGNLNDNSGNTNGNDNSGNTNGNDNSGNTNGNDNSGNTNGNANGNDNGNTNGNGNDNGNTNGNDNGSGLSILFSDPPSNSIDARQPFHIDGTNPQGWDRVVLTFNGSTSGLTSADFSTSFEGGSGSAPLVVQVVSNGNACTVILSDMISVGGWTTVQHNASGTSVRLGYLPADVNNDRTSSPVDILALIDFLNGVTMLAPYQTDVDRSDATNPADILRVIDLLNGADAYPPFLFASLPAGGGNGNSNGNANGNDNSGNTNGNANDNGNSNGNLNDNSGNTNGNDNGNVNGNDNGGNTNGNDNGNANGNLNDNSGNTNGNANGNDNGGGSVCPDGEVRLSANLVGGSAQGSAFYRNETDGRRRFQLSVSEYAAGTYNIVVNNVVVGQVNVGGSGSGGVDWDTHDGNFPGNFPSLTVGNPITVGPATGNFFLNCS